MRNASISLLLPQILGLFTYPPLSDIITTKYSTVHVLFDPACASFEPIVRSIQAHSAATTIIYRLDSNAIETIFTYAHNFANLYVFLFDRADSFRLIDGLYYSLSTAATKILFLMDGSAPVEKVESLATVALAPLQRYVLFRSDGAVWMHYRKLERIALDPKVPAATRALLHRVHHFHVADIVPSGDVTVYIHYSPPRSFLVPLRDADDNIEIIGTDSLMTYDIAKQLHVEPEICSDVAMFDVNFRGWFRKDYNPLYMNNNEENHLFNTRMHRWRASHRFDVNATHGEADLFCTSALIDPTKILDEDRKRDYLYPHSLDCISVVVPVNKVRVSFLEILGHHSIVGPVGVVLALMAFVRVAGRHESVVTAVLLTYGSFLAQLDVTETHRWSQKLWLSLMLLIALLASMVVSSAMYGIVMTVKYEAEIDTLEELIASGLPVLDVDLDSTFENPRLARLLPQRQLVTSIEHGMQLMYGFNTSNAYALTDTTAGYVLTLMNSVRQNDGPIFRIMKEPLECGLIAYQVPRASPLRAYVDKAIQAATEAGLYERYAVWAMQYFTSLYKALIPPDHSQEAVKWEGINGVFYIYFIGVAGATVAFVAEWIVWWLARK